MARYSKDKFYKIIESIINNEEFIKRKDFKHHGEESVYDHSLKVAYLAYCLAIEFHLDEKSCAIGGLLHDFYSTPWMSVNPNHPKKIREMHGFVHAKDAYRNASKFFEYLMTPKIKDIIVKHMFPLTPSPPIYAEAWLVTIADKIVSMSIFKKPKELPMYLGLNKKKNPKVDKSVKSSKK
ncbi:MAG: HD domain-containing protein [Bacilli bacterium]